VRGRLKAGDFGPEVHTLSCLLCHDWTQEICHLYPCQLRACGPTVTYTYVHDEDTVVGVPLSFSELLSSAKPRFVQSQHANPCPYSTAEEIVDRSAWTFRNSLCKLSFL
jgi:hypothetical protein